MTAGGSKSPIPSPTAARDQNALINEKQSRHKPTLSRYFTWLKAKITNLSLRQLIVQHPCDAEFIGKAAKKRSPERHLQVIKYLAAAR